MVVLVIVVVACFIAGVWASTRWLPPLSDGPVGTLVYFAVCGLAGGALALAAIRIWEIVHNLETRSFVAVGEAEVLASGLGDLIYEVGGLALLGVIAYLLAPKARGAQPTDSAP